MPNDKALQILFDTYWSSAGWKSKPEVSKENFKFARAAGYLFNPVKLSHGQTLNWLRKSFEAIDLIDVTNAFLASLSTRRLELRSALGSYTVARNFPSHQLQLDLNWGGCVVCGDNSRSSYPQDLNVLNFERYKWGGVRRDHPDYIALDLQEFKKLEKVEPNRDDLKIMRGILAIIKRSRKDARPRDLERQLKAVLPSNKAEREVLIQILAYCGILQPYGKPGYFKSFVPAHERTTLSDWAYPAGWWRGLDGINKEALKFYFPQFAK